MDQKKDSCWSKLNVYIMSSLHLNMLTPQLNRTTGTFDKCRLSHGLGVGTCEQRFSGCGAQRGKPDQRLRSPAVTHHPTAVDERSPLRPLLSPAVVQGID